jgi:hypothetical protein
VPSRRCASLPRSRSCAVRCDDVPPSGCRRMRLPRVAIEKSRGSSPGFAKSPIEGGKYEALDRSNRAGVLAVVALAVICGASYEALARRRLVFHEPDRAWRGRGAEDAPLPQKAASAEWPANQARVSAKMHGPEAVPGSSRYDGKALPETRRARFRHMDRFECGARLLSSHS